MRVLPLCFWTHGPSGVNSPSGSTHFKPQQQQEHLPSCLPSSSLSTPPVSKCEQGNNSNAALQWNMTPSLVPQRLQLWPAGTFCKGKRWELLLQWRCAEDFFLLASRGSSSCHLQSQTSSLTSQWGSEFKLRCCCRGWLSFNLQYVLYCKEYGNDAGVLKYRITDNSSLLLYFSPDVQKMHLGCIIHQIKGPHSHPNFFFWPLWLLMSVTPTCQV